MSHPELSSNQPMTSGVDPIPLDLPSGITQKPLCCQKDSSSLSNEFLNFKKALHRQITNKTVIKSEDYAAAADCAIPEITKINSQYRAYFVMIPCEENDFVKQWKGSLQNYETIVINEHDQIILVPVKDRKNQKQSNQIKNSEQYKIVESQPHKQEQPQKKEQLTQLKNQNINENNVDFQIQSEKTVQQQQNVINKQIEPILESKEEICNHEKIDEQEDSVIDESSSQLHSQQEDMSFIKYRKLDSAFIKQQVKHSKWGDSDSEPQPQLAPKINKIEIDSNIISSVDNKKCSQIQNTAKKVHSNKDTGIWKFREKVVVEQQKQLKTENENQKNLLANKPQTQKKPQWQQYLMHLSYAQTQATYLAQQMNWSIKFHQGISMIADNLFCCTTEMVVVSNYVLKKFVGICEGAKSKKQARHQASILCLADVYSSVDKVFERFKAIKQDNVALCQPMKANNSEIIDMWVNKRSLSDLEIIRLDRDEDKIVSRDDIDKYVSNLDSCKKQLYFFVAYNNKIFMMPKWKVRRPNILGYWDVQGWVKYEINNLIYEYRHKSGGHSKKVGQEKVSQAILKQIYRDFPYMFKRYKQIKQERGF